MNQQEIWAALVAGETVISPIHKVLYQFKQGILYQKANRPEWSWNNSEENFNHLSDCKIYKEPEWYENLTKPVLCKVWANVVVDESPRFAVIKSYQPAFSRRFVDMNNVCWGSATPLTESEWKEYRLSDNS